MKILILVILLILSACAPKSNTAKTLNKDLNESEDLKFERINVDGVDCIVGYKFRYDGGVAISCDWANKEDIK